MNKKEFLQNTATEVKNSVEGLGDKVEQLRK